MTWLSVTLGLFAGVLLIAWVELRRIADALWFIIEHGVRQWSPKDERLP